MRDRQCIHVSEHSLPPASSVVVVTLQLTPETIPDVCIAKLCPMCAGYLLGTVSKMEQSGIAELRQP